MVLLYWNFLLLKKILLMKSAMTCFCDLVLYLLICHCLRIGRLAIQIFHLFALLLFVTFSSRKALFVMIMNN